MQVFFAKKLENVGFGLTKADLDSHLRIVECIANLFVLFKEHAIEHLCENDHCIVAHFL